MRNTVIIGTVLCLSISSCSLAEKNDQYFEKINAQAAKEYLEPIRPASQGRNPCWNAYAQKFIYAPAFDFRKMDGAQKYHFIINDKRKPEKIWEFTAERPDADLSPVWNDITPANVHLKVEALDAEGKVLGIAGERDFLRDFPFCAPYKGKARPYREAALRAALYTHRMSAVQSWKSSNVPDLSYQLNSYPNKIHGGTIRNEVFIAENIPALREEALQIARSAAAFLLEQRRPEGHPLEFFPPTFYGTKASSGWADNAGTTMMMDATMAAHGFLDLFRATSDSLYLDAVLKIMNTYEKIQAPDGSFPVKVNYETGVPINNSKAMLHPILEIIQRLEYENGITDYSQMKAKCHQWMKDVPLSTFDITGQFEDTYHNGTGAYQNLTNCTAATYASVLLKEKQISEEDLRNADELIRMSEDQFVHWDALADETTGVREIFTPCVFEQYWCYKPVDASGGNMINAWLDWYERTGDCLALEKARAMADELTQIQDDYNGMIKSIEEPVEFFWINCNFHSLDMLMRMDRLDAAKCADR